MNSLTEYVGFDQSVIISTRSGDSSDVSILGCFLKAGVNFCVNTDFDLSQSFVGA